MRQGLGPAQTDKHGFNDPVDGAIESLSITFPQNMAPGLVDDAVGSLTASIHAIHEPPIASILEHSSSGDNRGFWIDFTADATEEQMVEVLHIVANAIRTVRRELGY